MRQVRRLLRNAGNIVQRIAMRLAPRIGSWFLLAWLVDHILSDTLERAFNYQITYMQTVGLIFACIWFAGVIAFEVKELIGIDN